MTMTIEPSPAPGEGPSTEDEVAAQVGAYAERLLVTGLAGLEAMTMPLDATWACMRSWARV